MRGAMRNVLTSWLPDMDLNHDKQIQSLLCYRYTIGQTGASNRLNPSLRESRIVKTLRCYSVKSADPVAIQRFNVLTN